MKSIDYTSKKDREIRGMFYLENFFHDDKKICKIIYSPDHKLVKPAFDYIRDKYFDKNFSEGKRERVAKSICHYLNFCRLHEIDLEKPLTNQCLIGFIKYMYVIPKRMFQRVKLHPTEVEILPVHPYISSNEKVVKRIYQEWYNEILTNRSDNFAVFFDSKNIKFDEDKLLWTHSFNAIKYAVNDVLEYMYWLSNSKNWNNRYQAIHANVARRIIKYNEYSKKYYIEWDIDERIKNETSLSPQFGSTRRKRRVFYETELTRFLNSQMLQNYPQRRLFFFILILTGCRESECLNLLMKNVKVKIVNSMNPYGKETLVCWEDMFDNPINDENVDILINKYLEFKIRVAKRPSYESKRRKNKARKARMTPLRDFFELPKLLDLKEDTILVNHKYFLESFYNEIILEKKERNPFELVEDIMMYHAEQKRQGIEVEDPRYAAKYRYMLEKLREVFNNCWFGNILRKYLIERQLLLNKIEQKRVVNSDYLFINLKINKGSPIEPETVNTTWFNVICDKVEPKLIRTSYTPNKILGHAKKNDLTTHSFRHTYISARICLETEEGRYNDALLKREIGHVATSTVAETIYFFSDGEKTNKAITKLFRYMKEHMESLTFKEVNEGEISE